MEKWWAVAVECRKTGIRDVHCVSAVFASTAKKQEETAGYIVLYVTRWNDNRVVQTH